MSLRIPLTTYIVCLCLLNNNPTHLPYGGENLTYDNSVRSTSATSSAQQTTFAQVLKHLSKQTGKLFIAEGEPYLASLRDDIVSKEMLNTILACKNFDKDSLQTALGVFDYDVEQIDDIVYLRKRYLRIEELPEVTFSEYANAVSAVSQLFARNGVDKMVIWESAVDQFISMLKPEQIKNLNDTTKSEPSSPKTWQGVPIADLPSEQHEYLYTMAVNEGFSRVYPELEYTNDLLQAIPKKETRFGRFKVLNIEALAIRLNLPHPQRTEIHSLDQRVYNLPAGILFTPDEKFAEYTHENLWDGQPANLIPGKSYFQGGPQPLHNAGRTLTELIDEVNKKSPIKYRLQKELEGRIVCWFDKAQIDNTRMIAAVTTLFGLTRIQEADGTVLIRRPYPTLQPGIQGIGSKIKDILPEPLTRAMNHRLQAIVDRKMVRLRCENTSENMLKMLIGSESALANISVMNQLNDTLRQRLSNLIAIRCEVKENSDKQVPRRIMFTDLEEEEKRLVGLICILRIYKNLMDLQAPLPRTITHFNEGKVRIYSYNRNNVKMLKLEMSFPGNGNSSEDLGFLVPYKGDLDLNSLQ